MPERSQDSTRVYEERWKRARNPGQEEPLSIARNVEGDWRVKRLSGPVPMPFVWKSIRDGRGTTRVSPRGASFGPGLPFRLEQREGHVALIYTGPLSFLVDELRREADGSWLGRAKVAGIQYAWFRLIPM